MLTATATATDGTLAYYAVGGGGKAKRPRPPKRRRQQQQQQQQQQRQQTQTTDNDDDDSRRQRFRTLGDRTVPVPGVDECRARFPSDDRFQIILADPPWCYVNAGAQGHVPYATQSLQDICSLPVASIADSQCLLFLWATFPKLGDALQVMHAWGFRYRGCFKTWIKLSRAGVPRLGCGYYARANGELLLLGIRGSGMTRWRLHRSNMQVLLTTQPVQHSHKPPVIRRMIEQYLSPHRRIELYAREVVPGWSAWGLEVPGCYHRDPGHDRPDLTPDALRTTPDRCPGNDTVGVYLVLPSGETLRWVTDASDTDEPPPSPFVGRRSTASSGCNAYSPPTL